MQLTQSTEQLIIAASNKTTIIGAGTAAAAGAAEKSGMIEFLSANSAAVASLCMIGGLIIAMLGFLVSVFFQWRRDLRQAEAHKRAWREEAHNE